MKTRNLIIIACLLAGCVPQPVKHSSGGDGPTVAPVPVKPVRGPGFYRDLIGYMPDGAPIYRDTIIEGPNPFKVGG